MVGCGLLTYMGSVNSCVNIIGIYKLHKAYFFLVMHCEREGGGSRSFFSHKAFRGAVTSDS